MLPLYDDQHLFDTILQARRNHEDLFEGSALTYYRCPPHGHTFREHPVVAGRVEHLPDIDLLLVFYILDRTLALPQTFQRSVNTVLLGNDASAETRVGDEKNLRRGRVGFENLADDTVRRHDGHAFHDSRAGTLVHVDYPRVRAGAGSDYTSRNGPRWSSGLKGLQRLGPIRSVQLGSQEMVLHLQLAKFLRQLPIFLTDID
jgi:hypothetical protein